MTSKELRKLKHELKLNIDKVSNWIKIAEIGLLVGITEDEEALEQTSESRKSVKESLEAYKKLIAEQTESFIEEIDSAIKKMN